MKKLAWFYFLTLMISILSGCSGSTVALIDPIIQQQAPKLVIVSHPVGEGYYAVLDKTHGHWQVLSISTTPVTRRANDKQEILFVNRRLRSIAPSFDPRVYTGQATECTPYIDDDQFYGLCNSYFSTSDVGTSIVRNFASCFFTLCLAAGTREVLDHGKIQQVVLESNLIDIVKQLNSAESHQVYLAGLSR
jgi:hypothetical protein